MTVEEKKICDECGEEIKPENKNMWDEMLEPYHEVEIESKGMQVIASGKRYYKKKLHFHDDCLPDVLKELSRNY